MMSKNAFTLVELLIVVVIIGILAAIAIPQYNKMRERTIVSEVVSNFSILERASIVYRLQTDKWPHNGQSNWTEPGIPDYLDVTIAQSEYWDYSVHSPTQYAGDIYAHSKGLKPYLGYKRFSLRMLASPQEAYPHTKVYAGDTSGGGTFQTINDWPNIR